LNLDFPVEWIMNKNEKVVLQCADCDHKYKKTVKWLENTHVFECTSCNAELDVDEVINDIMSGNNDTGVFLIYEK